MVSNSHSRKAIPEAYPSLSQNEVHAYIWLNELMSWDSFVDDLTSSPPGPKILPGQIFYPSELSSRTRFHLTLFFSAILCPHPCSHFLFPQCKGISTGTAHSVWWAWGASRGHWSREGPRQGLSSVSLPGLGRACSPGGWELRNAGVVGGRGQMGGSALPEEET